MPKLGYWSPMKWFVAVFFCLQSTVVLASSDVDAFKLRKSMGEEAFRAQIADMKQRLGQDIDYELLAKMIIADKSLHHGGYQRAVKSLYKLAAKDRAEINGIAQGQYPELYKNSKWLKNAFAAKDPVVRSLFERAFMDTYVPFNGSIYPWFYSAFIMVYPEKIKYMRANAAWLKETLKTIGWFDISKYGEDASIAAWTIVQHADFDPDWQEGVLLSLEARLVRRDVQPRYYAYLADHVAVARGKPQKYGTAGRCVGGEWAPYMLDDAWTIDVTRSKMGLGSLSDQIAKFHCR